jgi:hypothetical protein
LRISIEPSAHDLLERRTGLNGLGLRDEPSRRLRWFCLRLMQGKRHQAGNSGATGHWPEILK